MNDEREYDSNAPLWSLLVGLIGVAGLAGTIMYEVYTVTHQEVVERVKRPTLPQSCAHLLRPVIESEWNPETDTYPPNYEWENCMGVGRK